MESQIMRQIQVALSTVGARVFRNNVAEGWVGKFIIRAEGGEVIKLQPGDVVLRNARVLHAGLCVGSSDLIGFSAKGTFVACEVKAESGRLEDNQGIFIGVVKSFGGIAFVARSPDEAIQKYKEFNGE